MSQNKGKKETSQVQEHEDAEVVPYRKNMFREVVEVLLYGLALLIFVKSFVFQNFQIPTKSMENTLLIGDHITANTFIFKNASSLDKVILPFREIKRGDVIVFKYPGDEKQDWIKRCIGIPGDQFRIIDDGVYIKGARLDERYPFYKMASLDDDRDRENRYYPLDYNEIKPGLNENAPGQSLGFEVLRERTREQLSESFQGRPNMDGVSLAHILKRLDSSPEGIIPDGFYLMMGDNRNNSNDSRYWGLAPRELIQGRAWFVWWSYGEVVDSHKLQGWQRIKSYLQLPITFWTRTRWKNSFKLIK